MTFQTRIIQPDMYVTTATDIQSSYKYCQIDFTPTIIKPELMLPVTFQ